MPIAGPVPVQVLLDEGHGRFAFGPVEYSLGDKGGSVTETGERIPSPIPTGSPTFRAALRSIVPLPAVPIVRPRFFQRSQDRFVHDDSFALHIMSCHRRLLQKSLSFHEIALPSDDPRPIEQCGSIGRIATQDFVANVEGILVPPLGFGEVQEATERAVIVAGGDNNCRCRAAGSFFFVFFFPAPAIPLKFAPGTIAVVNATFLKQCRSRIEIVLGVN
mmetsp:Transcript_17446/g.50839  ORF Transcript_17446/g.50839 Transcript_17446/m.50839 type:complete len:218 (-) Transcript_17446:704-1357(-)